MKFLRIGLGLAWLWAGGACAQDHIRLDGRTNLVLNGGFERAVASGGRPQNWTISTPTSNTLGWGWTYVSNAALARTGARCLAFSNVFSRGLWWERLYAVGDRFPLSPTNRYLWRVWYRTAGVGDGELFSRLRYYDAATNEIQSEMIRLDAAETGWRPFDLFVQPPHDALGTAAWARVQFYMDHSAGTVWLDDFGLYPLGTADVPVVYPFGRYRAPVIETNGPPVFPPQACTVPLQDAQGVWWFVEPSGTAFYFNATGTGVSENETLAGHVLTNRGLSLTQYDSECKVRAQRDLKFNAAVKITTNGPTVRLIDWLNFSTETGLAGTDWVLKNAAGETFGDVDHYFPDPFNPVWQAHATNEANGIQEWFVERADAVGYWTDNEWAYGPMWEYFWSAHCQTAFVGWLQGTLPVPAGFEHPAPYTGIAQVNARWSSIYHTYAYSNFADIHGADKPRLRAFDDPAAADLLGFERVVFKKYVDAIVSAIRAREDYLLAQLSAAGKTGYHHNIISCRIAWEGPGYHDLALRRNLDIFGAFDLLAVNAYPVMQNAADHHPRSHLVNLRRTFHETTGRPVLVAEFGIAARDAAPLVDRWHDRTVYTQAERGVGYRNLVSTWINQPWMIGQVWFKWANGYGEPSGSDPRNCGLVDDQDHYYAGLTNQMVQTNLRAARASRRGTFNDADIDWCPLVLPAYESEPPTLVFSPTLNAGMAYTTTVSISWSAVDPDSCATINLYAGMNANLLANGAPLVTGLVVGAVTQWTWQVGACATGLYYLAAEVADGSGPPRWFSTTQALAIAAEDFNAVITVYPSNTMCDLDNPHKGFMLWGTDYAMGAPDNYYGSTVFHVYVPWREIESSDQVFDWGRFETNHLRPILADYPAATFVLRPVADYPDGENSGITTFYSDGEWTRDFPRFLIEPPLSIASWPYTACDGDGPGWTPDWNNAAMITQMVQFVQALATQYDGDPRITAIQVGLLGLWGEWHQSGCDEHAPGPAAKTAVRDAYAAGFTRTPLQTRYARDPDARGVEFGFHEDYFPSYTAPCVYDFPDCRDSGDWNLDYGFRHVVTGAVENWKYNPVSGESPLATQKRAWSNDFADVMTVLRDYHFSFLGPAGGHEQNGNQQLLNQMKRLLGYNFHVVSCTAPKILEIGRPLQLTLVLTNSGAAPCYHPCPVEIALCQTNGVPVWTNRCSMDLRTLLPGNLLSHTESFWVSGVATGQYSLRLGVIDPRWNRPGIRLQTAGEDGNLRYAMAPLDLRTSRDTDGDGVPDWWEELYYGGPTQALASALVSNGVNTVREAYLAGLNPTNAASVFQCLEITGAAVSSDWKILRWEAVLGRTYAVAWASNPVAENWSPFSPQPTNAFTDTQHGAMPAGYYQLRVAPY